MAINKKNSIRTDININSKGATSGLNKIDKSTKKSSSGIKVLGRSFNLLQVGITAAVASFALIIKKGAEFGKALSSLEAVSGATSKEMQTLSNQAKELGASTAFTASEVVSLQTELAKLGNSASDIEKSTPAILNLAASLEVGLADAASFAGSTVNAFGLEAEDTQRIVDVMAESAASSAQDFSTLKESFTKAAPAASALGVSVERTSALLGVLANSGITGSEAGTALKNSFIELKREGLTLEEGLAKIKNSSDKLGTAIDLAGKRGGPALLILSKNQEGIGELEDKLNGASGAAERMAEIKLDNLAGDVTKLQSAFEGFILGIYSGTGAFNDFLRGIVQGVSTMLNLFTATEKVSDSMRAQQSELYLQEAAIDRLDKVIGDATTSEEDLVKAQKERVRIIKQMIKQNPTLLAGIDAESVATAQLKDTLVEVNRALVKKLIIQEKEEEFQKQALETKDATLKVMDQEKKIQEQIAIIRQEAAKDGIRIDATDAEGVKRRLRELKADGDLGMSQKARYDTLNGLINQQKINQQVLNNEEQKGIDLLKVKEELLGKSEKTEIKKTEVDTDTEVDAAVEMLTGESDEEREIREAKEKKARDKEDKAREQRKKDIKKFKEDLSKQDEDQDADTEAKKIELARQRHLEKLESLNLEGEEETAAKLIINQLYDDQEKERKDLFDEEKEAKDKEKKEAERELQLEIDAIELERILQDDQLKFDKREELQLAYLEKKRLNDLKNEELTEKEREAINKRAEKAKQKVRDTEASASKDLKKKVLDDALDGAAQSFGIAQEVAVAKMLMAAPEAISGSFKEAAKAYAPPMSIAMGALGAAGVVAPIVKGLADIKKNRFSKGGKTSGSTPPGTINTSVISTAASSSGISADTVSSLSANNAARLSIDPSIGGAASSSAANNVMGGASGSVVFSESSYQSFQNQVNFREELTTVGG
tara:strand:+ start:1099 stop:3927 length:2829 start_codon:yes stop_codon:yes gene_type:complete